MDSTTHHVTGVADLEKIAQQVVTEIEVGDVLLLEGELGSGKTTFTQYIAQAFGVTDLVTSPTFTIVGEYEIPKHGSLQWLVHIDLYRIPEDQHGVDKEYIAEIIDTAKEHKRVVVVEWPERLELTLDQAAWHISFEYGKSEEERIVTISKAVV